MKTTYSPKRIGTYIAIIHRKRKVILNRMYKQKGLERLESGIIIQLFKNPGKSQQELSEYFRKDKAAIAKSILRLINTGYVEREKSTKDKRKYQLYLTEKGKNVQPVIVDIRDKTEELLLDGFDDNEKVLMRNLLSHMADNAINTINDMNNKKKSKGGF